MRTLHVQLSSVAARVMSHSIHVTDSCQLAVWVTPFTHLLVHCTAPVFWGRSYYGYLYSEAFAHCILDEFTKAKQGGDSSAMSVVGKRYFLNTVSHLPSAPCPARVWWRMAGLAHTCPLQAHTHPHSLTRAHTNAPWKGKATVSSQPFC